MARITKNGNQKFSNKQFAIIAMQQLQLHYAMLGYLVTSSCTPFAGYVLLTVHFGDNPYPTTPNGAVYTKKEICSHWYYSLVTKAAAKCTTLDYYFEY